jgi:guanyl-specific ribonuclease Sa
MRAPQRHRGGFDAVAHGIVGPKREEEAVDFAGIGAGAIEPDLRLQPCSTCNDAVHGTVEYGATGNAKIGGRMRRHLRNPWVWVAAALLFALWLLWPRAVNSPAPAPPATPVSVPAATPANTPPDAPKSSARAGGDSRTQMHSAPAFLPPEALRTLGLIERGGPFPHRQDGSVFGNREGRLPSMPRGYYHEYTVETPGLSHRGTRRIVTGGTPPEAWYYSEDHYESFRSFAWPPGGAR